MSLIKNIKQFPAKRGNKHALLMCGFGGSIWQTWRLIKLLNQNGYNVTALDFSKEALSLGDPALLPSLTDEVAAFAENEAKRLGSPPLLIGISLGALMSLNILRRSTVFMKGVLITGGDIVKVAKKIYRNAVWPQSYTELAALWQKRKHVHRPGKTPR